MSYAPSSFSFSLAVGTSGAYVDVTPDVLFDSGSITRTWGTQNQFIPVGPGTFQLTLDNRTGNYSPDNPNTSLATPLGEGTGCCWSLNGQLRSGQVRAVQPVFTDIGVPANSSQMRVTVTDMLGMGALTTLGDLAYSQVLGANPYLFWPLNDPASSGQAIEVTGNGFPLTPLSPASSAPGSFTFGSPGFGALGEDTQLQFTSPVVLRSAYAPNLFAPNFAASGNLGVVGAWVTATATPGAGTTFGVDASLLSSGFGLSVSIGSGGSGYAISGSFKLGTQTTVGPVPIPPGVPTYCAFGATYTLAGTTYTFTFTLYMNGVAVASGTLIQVIPVPGPTFRQVAGFISDTQGGGDIVSLAHFSYAPALIHEEYAGITTLANRLAAIDQTTQLVTLGTLPTDFSSAAIGYPATKGQSSTDALITAMLTEQGYIDTVTAGTFLAPVQTVRTRARNRPTTISASFSVGTDLQGAPNFARSLNDEISLENVTGSNSSSRTVINQTLVARVGSANASDTILTFQQSDLYEWGSDRIWRGIKRSIDITSITLDASSGPTLWNTLTSLNPGDRIEITGLPSAQLGYSTWDGFLIGSDETHIDKVQSQFTLYLAPATPATAIFDTDLFANGGNNTISTALTSSATSMVTASADLVTAFEGTTVNYFLLIDQELVKVTAAGALSAGSQTLTIARAQGGTTAATHAVGAVPEVITNSIFAF